MANIKNPISVIIQQGGGGDGENNFIKVNAEILTDLDGNTTLAISDYDENSTAEVYYMGYLYEGESDMQIILYEYAEI